VAGRRLLGHGGGYPGHITRTLFDAQERFAVSVFTNAIDGPAAALARGVVRVLDLAARAQAGLVAPGEPAAAVEPNLAGTFSPFLYYQF